jgi:hypothetical protein
VTRRYGRDASAPVTSADITRALRILFPVPVKLRTDTDRDHPGRFVIRLPSASARQLGLTADGPNTTAGGWLTRHLHAPVKVIHVRSTRWSARGSTYAATIEITQPGGEG